jgi:hypothetical protein
MKSHWVEHKGKRVFIAEFSNFGMDSVALGKEADEIVAALQKEPPHSVISISNVTSTTATKENIEILQNVLPHTNQQVYKRCVVGIDGLRWYFVRFINDFTGKAGMEVFPSLQAALDWIVAD